MVMKPFCRQWPAGFKEGDQVTCNSRPATVISTGRRVPAGEVPITFNEDDWDNVITVPADSLYPLPKRRLTQEDRVARGLCLCLIVIVVISVLSSR